jgi:hypothetical protein
MTTPGMQGEVSPESMGKTTGFSRRGARPTRNRQLPQLLGTLRNKLR